MSIKYVKTDDTINVIINNVCHVVSTCDPKYSDIWKCIKDNDLQKLTDTLQEKIHYEDNNWFISNKRITVYGYTMETIISQKLYQRIKYGQDINNIINFYNRLPEHTYKDKKSITNISLFIARENSVIMPDGSFIDEVDCDNEIYSHTVFKIDKNSVVKKIDRQLKTVRCLPEDIKQIYVDRNHYPVVVMEKVEEV